MKTQALKGTRSFIAECIVDYLPAAALKNPTEIGYHHNNAFAFLNFKIDGVVDGVIRIFGPQDFTFSWSNGRMRKYPKAGQEDFQSADTMLKFINDIFG